MNIYMCVCMYVCVCVCVCAYLYTSSSSSCRSAGTDFPDFFTPFVSIINRFLQVL